jgi:hypothetical protein
MDLVLATTAGVLSGLVFIFLFPGRAISTLMHEVLHLPGPGAGIGFIVGPYMVMCALIMRTYIRKAMVAFYVIVVSGTVQAYFGPITTVMFGPSIIPYVILSSFVLGTCVDFAAFALRNKHDGVGFPVVAIISTIIFMVAYWVWVFPPVKGWVTPEGAMILIPLSIVGAVLFGALPAIVYSYLTGNADKRSADQCVYAKEDEEE